MVPGVLSGRQGITGHTRRGRGSRLIPTVSLTRHQAAGQELLQMDTQKVRNLPDSPASANFLPVLMFHLN